MLCHELERHNMPIEPALSRFLFADTLPAAREVYSHLPSRKLGSIYEHISGMDMPNAHDALADCEGLHVVATSPDIAEALEPMSLTELLQLHGFDGNKGAQKPKAAKDKKAKPQKATVGKAAKDKKEVVPRGQLPTSEEVELVMQQQTEERQFALGQLVYPTLICQYQQRILQLTERDQGKDQGGKCWPAKTSKGLDCKLCLKKGSGSWCHHHS